MRLVGQTRTLLVFNWTFFFFPNQFSGPVDANLRENVSRGHGQKRFPPQVSEMLSLAVSQYLTV